MQKPGKGERIMNYKRCFDENGRVKEKCLNCTFIQGDELRGFQCWSSICPNKAEMESE